MVRLSRRLRMLLVAAMPAFTGAADAGQDPSGAATSIVESPISYGLPADFAGPPPPIPPEVITRDEEGHATVRAIRLAVPLRIDGGLDEALYRDVSPISG